MDNQKLKKKDSLTPSIYQPSERLVENWKFWIAHEVVEQWQQSSQDRTDLKITLNLDDKQFLSETSDKLKAKIESEKLALNASENIEKAKLSIEKYFDEIALSFQKRLKTKRSISTKSFKESLSANFHALSPDNLTSLIANYANFFTKRRNYFETEKNTHLRRQASAGIAFINLSEKFNSLASNSLGYMTMKESIWNALRVYFESKLLAKNFTVLHQTTLGLLELCQSYLDSVTRSSEVLELILKSLKGKSSLDILSIPVFSYFKKINALEQKEKIEIWSGHRMNHWGNAPVSWQQIEARLLENLESVAFDIYMEFQECFFEHGILFAKSSEDECILHPSEYKSQKKGLVNS